MPTKRRTYSRAKREKGSDWDVNVPVVIYVGHNFLEAGISSPFKEGGKTLHKGRIKGSVAERRSEREQDRTPPSHSDQWTHVVVKVGERTSSKHGSTPSAKSVDVRAVDALIAEGVEQHSVVVGDLRMEIQDSGVQKIVEQFFGRLARLNEGLSEANVTRVLELMDDALPPTEGIPETDLGPFYTSAGLARRWEVSRQAINRRVGRNTLLGIPADDGSLLYPSFQFLDANNPRPKEVLPGLSTVIATLSAAGGNPLSIASWLTAPDDRLDGLSAAEWLWRAGDTHSVVRLAEADVDRWQQ